MDTGADVTAIPSHIFDKFTNVRLSVSDWLLKGPGQEILTVKGKFTTELKWQQKNCQEDVYVIEKLQRPLIGRPAIERLGLLVRVGIVDDSLIEKYRNKYPTVFTGLRKLQHEYSIKLTPDAVPFSITAPRRIP